MKRTKWIWGIAMMASAVVLSVGCFTAFATDVATEADAAEPQTSEAASVPGKTTTATDAEPEKPATEQSEYSYLIGRKRSTERNELYVQAEQLPEDERDAFLSENGIGETPYSEEAVESYSYVVGRQRGASYRQDDDEDTQDISGYSFQIGQERGASYQK